MIRRARLSAVLAFLVAGATGMIASTQTWLTVVVADGAREALSVPGSAALPVLVPLSLTLLALGAALSIVGTVARYILGALGLIVGLYLGWSALAIAIAPPVGAAAATVTEATGIAGLEGVAALVDSLATTPWPAVAGSVQVLAVAAAALTLATARRWRAGSGRRYTPAAGSRAGNGSRPHDAIDSWDDLSRGDDPTR